MEDLDKIFFIRKWEWKIWIGCDHSAEWLGWLEYHGHSRCWRIRLAW
jgi:hypothetical protein